MKKNSSSMKTPKRAFIALFTLFCCSFGNTVMAQTTLTAGTDWSTATWSAGVPSTIANNTNITTINVANSNVDNTYYQRRLYNDKLITTDATLSTSNSGTVVIDVNEDFFYNNATQPKGITNQSTTGKRFKIDCNVRIANSYTTTTNNRHTSLRCEGNAVNVLEFGSNSVLDLQGNGPTALHPVLGTIEMNGKIKGNNTLYVGGTASLYTVTFGATSNNTDFNTANCNIFIGGNANLVVNTAPNGTFFKNTSGGKFSIFGGNVASTTTINSANVWNSILSIGNTGGSNARLILNEDQTANTGAVEMTTATAILNLTVAAGKSVTFGNSSANTWEVGSLFNIYGFDTATSVKFGNDNTGLTATQLGQIVIKDGAHIGEAVVLDNTGKLVLAASLSNKENLSQFNFQFYPNPAKDFINVSTAKSIDTVSFFNVLGQKVQSNAVNATQKQIDISNLQKAIYVMEVTIGNAKQSFKIVKE